MACKRIRSKMRKMQGGGMTDVAMQGKQLEQQLANSLTPKIADKMNWGVQDPNTGMVGEGSFFRGATHGLISSGGNPIAALIGGFRGKKQAGEANVLAQNRTNLMNAYNEYNRSDILPGQESYTPLMPDGGQVGYETVELEKGEPYQLPDGTIESIPTSAPSHAKGGVVIDLPSGTRVLGKKKAMNGKQFKKLGRKLKNSQSRYNKSMEESPTSIETRTAKRMLNNINTEYDSLFKAQGEDVNTSKRFKKGGKVPKYYGENPTNNNSMEVGYGSNWWDVQEPQFTPTQPTLYTVNKNTSSSQPIPYASEMIARPYTGGGNDWRDALSAAGALAPTAYNLYQSQQPIDAWREEEFKNPYAEGSRRLMRSRRYNVQPELEAGRSNVAAYNRRLRESGLSKGQLMGGLQAGSLAKTKSDASTLARAQNVNAQYMAEQAKFDYGVGEDISRRRQMVRDYNARAEAARQNMAGTGLSQLSQYSQLQQYQRNQQGRDAQRLALLPDYIQNYLYDPKAGYNFITK